MESDNDNKIKTSSCGNESAPTDQRSNKARPYKKYHYNIGDEGGASSPNSGEEQTKVVRPCNENDPGSTCKEVLNMETSRKAKKAMGGRRGCCVEEESDIPEGGGGC